MEAITKVIAGILGLFLVILVIGFGIRMIKNSISDDVVVTAPSVTTQAVHEEFRQTIIARATERLGRPVEGFDARLLMMALPGLEPRDFNGVAATHGRYEYRDGVLHFIPTSNALAAASTALRTLSPQGYGVLYENLRTRLQGSPEETMFLDRLDMEAMVPYISTVPLLGSVEAFGTSVTPVEVIEDSPSQYGAAPAYVRMKAVRARVTSGGGEHIHVFSLHEPHVWGTLRITLIDVVPYPETVHTGSMPYEFTFKMERH